MKRNKFFKNRGQNKTRSAFNKQIRFESLEDRRLMAVDMFLDQQTGILYMEGTDTTRDSAEIRIDTKGTSSTTDDRVVATLKTSTGVGNLSKNYARSSVKEIVFNGYAGNDKFNNRTSIPSEADGGTGNDILLGGYSKDTVYGGDGKDYIDGRNGNDKLYGGSNNDLIFGDKGDDFIYGGTGADFLFGGVGRDSIWGESGMDSLDGGPDTELKMIGGTNTDTFIDDTTSFPGGDFKSNDISSTKHSALGMFDYNIADNTDRPNQRLAAYLASQNTDPIPNPDPIPTPDPTPKPDPIPMPVDLNAKVLSYAQSVIGQRILRGECTDLIAEALRLAGAKGGSNFSQPGFYVWGQAVSLSSAKAGDIIQFSPNAKFVMPNSWTQMGPSGHTAIIESINGNVVTLLEQNAPIGGPVRRSTLDLSKIEAGGSFQIFRPIPA
jgi:hypothetical protein